MRIGARDTVRLQLRPIAAEDLDFAAGLFSLPQMLSHRPDPSPEPRAALRDRLTMDRVHWRTHGFGRWLLSDGGGPVGLGGLTLKDGFEGLNISFHIHPDHWGKGYATEFGREALAVAFGPLAAARVIGLARPANVASRAVLRRLGFRHLRDVPLGPAPTGLFERRRPLG